MRTLNGEQSQRGLTQHICPLQIDIVDRLIVRYSNEVAAIPARLRDRDGASLPIFPTRTGGRLNASNVRNRLLTETVKRANERRAKEGRMLLPERVTPHTLRRTFASLCFFVGRDLRWVMGQLGHDDPRMTLAVYAQAMKRKRVEDALVWKLMRFPDEPEIKGFDPTIGPMTDRQGAR